MINSMLGVRDWGLVKSKCLDETQKGCFEIRPKLRGEPVYEAIIANYFMLEHEFAISA